MRVVYVALFAGAVFAVYINGVAEGWWPAWGERPTVAAATTAPAARPVPTASATASGEAAMSGGYQIGPDGVLVRPAEHAASTYTKPELPEEAKQNTEEGAEAAARHYLDLIVYAWNTGDTQPLADMSATTSEFASSYVSDISERYQNGWTYGSSATITYVLRIEPMAANGSDVPEGTVLTKFRFKSDNGTTCIGKRIFPSGESRTGTLSLLMTWTNGRWIETQGRIVSDNEE